MITTAIRKKFMEYPVIAAVRTPEDFEAAFHSKVKIIFMVGGDVFKCRKKIQEAKEQGKYKGRKRKGTDTQLLEDAIRAFQEKEMSLEEALHLTNLSKSTFYRRIREQNER